MKPKLEDEYFTRNMATEREMREYKVRQNSYLYTNRFNDKTYEENRNFCNRCGLVGVYSCLYPLPESVESNANVYVLEMNNSRKKIMAIGRIVNEYRDDIYRIYESHIYNNKHYRVKERIEISKMKEDEQEMINALEKQCFYGKGHLMRGKDLRSFPWLKMATCAKNGYDLLEKIRNMFEKRKRI